MRGHRGKKYLHDATIEVSIDGLVTRYVIEFHLGFFVLGVDVAADVYAAAVRADGELRAFGLEAEAEEDTEAAAEDGTGGEEEDGVEGHVPVAHAIP